MRRSRRGESVTSNTIISGRVRIWKFVPYVKKNLQTFDKKCGSVTCVIWYVSTMFVVVKPNNVDI